MEPRANRERIEDREGVNWLQQIYDTYGIHQGLLARETGITRSTLTRIIQRNTPMGKCSYEVVTKILKYVNKVKTTKEK